MFTFLWPYLVLLLPLPWLVYRFMPPAKKSSQDYIPFPFYHLLCQADDRTGNTKIAHNRIRICWLSLIWLGLVLALMRPQIAAEHANTPTDTRNLMLAVDLSDSMRTQDMRVQGYATDRLTVIKLILSTFIEERQGDQIGLILFGRKAYLQSPFTMDTQLIQQYLNEAAIGLAGKQTAIGDAIGLTLKRMHQQTYRTAKQKPVLILVTDGTNTAGAIAPLAAAELAAKQQLKIYTIGIGADPNTSQNILDHFFNGQQTSDLDETTLQRIAQMTGGQYFRARTAADLTDIYDTLNQLEPVSGKPAYFRLYRNLHFIPLAMATLLAIMLLLFPLIRHTWQKRQQTNAHP